MKKAKKITAVIMVLVMLVTAFAGCGSENGSSSSQAGAGNMKILAVVADLDAFRQTLTDAAVKEAESRGMTLDIVTTPSSDEQVAAMEQAEGQGYQVILCNPVDVDTALQLEIAAGNLPVVFFNSCPAEKRLEKGKYIYAGSDDGDAGTFQAQYVLDHVSSQELNVVLFKGSKGHSATVGRTEAVKKIFAESGRQVNYVFEDYADWDTEKTKHMFELFLKTGQTADCVICNNDSMALGVIEACKENNIDPSSIPILGVDATADGCAAVAAGEMSYTVCQSAEGQGKACIDAAEALAAGGDISGVDYATDNQLYLYVPFEPVTKDNVADYQ